MAKQKKITVTYLPKKTKVENVYAIYIRITYNGKSNMFNTGGIMNALSLQHAKELLNNPDNKLLNIKKLVRFEINHSLNSDNYSIVGFKDRLDTYQSSFSFFWGGFTLSTLLKILEDYLTYRKYIELNDLLTSIDYSPFFALITMMEVIKEKYNIKFEESLKDYLFQMTYLSGSFICFSYERKMRRSVNDYSKEFLSLDSSGKKTSQIEFYKSVESVGDWLLNESVDRINDKDIHKSKPIKKAFIDYLDHNPRKILDILTKNRFNKIFPLEEFEAKDGYSLVAMLNQSVNQMFDLNIGRGTYGG